MNNNPDDDSAQLDAPLSARGFFLRISYIGELLKRELSITRAEISTEEADARPLDLAPVYAWLCSAFIDQQINMQRRVKLASAG